MPRRHRSRRHRPRVANINNLVNFNKRNVFRFAIDMQLKQASSTPAVSIYAVSNAGQIGNLTPILGIQLLLDAFDSMRVRSLHIEFDGRGINPSPSEPGVANPRVGAFLLEGQTSNFDVSKVPPLATFCRAFSQVRRMRINLRVGPEFTLGRFGPKTTAGTSLIVAYDGFQGAARVFVEVEATGPPASLTVPALTSSEHEPMEFEIVEIK